MEAPHHEKRGPQEEGPQRRGVGCERGGVWQGLSWGPGICEESGGLEGTKAQRRERGFSETKATWEGARLCKGSAQREMLASEGMGAQ